LARNCNCSGCITIGKFCISLYILATHPRMIIAGVYSFESERYCCFLPNISMKVTGAEHDSKCQILSTSCVLINISYGRLIVYPSATQIFQFPSLVAMTIAATRMYRSLSDFVFGGTDMYYFFSFLSSPLTVVDNFVAFRKLAFHGDMSDLQESREQTNPSQFSSTQLKWLSM
jgi:hypothetical protein